MFTLKNENENTQKMKTIRKSIGTKIRVLFFGFTLLLSLFFALMLVAYSWIIEDNVFNRLVAYEAAYIQSVFEQQGVISIPKSRFMTLYSSWAELPEDIQRLRQQSPTRIEFPLNGEGTLHLTTLQLGQKEMILAADVTAYEVSRDYFPSLAIWLIITVVFVCLLALFLSWRVSLTVVKPIQQLSKWVKDRNTTKDVSIAGTFSNDEIGYLAHTIEDNINQLQAALTRESDFTRDVSHEIRTPVTVLTMLDSQLTDSGMFSPTMRSHFTQSIQQIEHTVTVLLALARKESLQHQSLYLLAEIEECAINHYALTQREDFHLVVDVAQSYKIAINKNLLHIMLKNLFDNAINHSNSNELSIQLKDNNLTFSNSTKHQVPDNIFDGQIKSETSQGLGLGLHLVKRICQRAGWQVKAVNNERVFCLTIEFS
jgi:signal transduction histidine kinase